MVFFLQYIILYIFITKINNSTKYFHHPDGDVKGLRRQFEEHSGFKHQLEERGEVIRNHLNNGLQLISGKFKLDKPDFDACLRQLELEWSELLERSSEWNDDIVRMMDNVKAYEDRIKELNKM